MEFNTTFNNISIISWLSVLLVEKTRVPLENHRPVACKLYHIMLCRVHFTKTEIRMLVMTGTDCISSCKFNYLTIITTMTPCLNVNCFLWSSVYALSISCQKGYFNFVVGPNYPKFVISIFSVNGNNLMISKLILNIFF